MNILRFLLAKVLNFPKNAYHPLVWIVGNPEIGENVYIGAFTEINANKSEVVIGNNCDIASFVSINCADSHKRTIGISIEIERSKIEIGNSVFIGSHSIVKGGAKIGDRCVIAAGTVVDGVEVPPLSLVYGNPMKIKIGYYENKK